MLSTILIFIGILALLVLVHELGHFIAARKSGVAVEEFGFGFPPRLFHIKKGKTIFSINLLPLGGFVKIKGVAGDDKNTKRYKDKDSFATKPFWKKAIILSAGVAMNLLLAWALLSFGLGLGLPSAVTDENAAMAENIHIQIAEVTAGSPAEKADLRIGDVVLKIGDQDVTEVETIRDYNLEHKTSSVTLDIQRGKQTLQKDITLATIDGEDYLLGITLLKTGIIRYPWYEAIWLGFQQTFLTIWLILVALVGLVRDLFVNGTVSADVSGPVGIAVLTGRFAQLGLAYLMQFTAILSINLAIINFFPFPALDGGRLLFVVIEKLRGKPISARVEGIVHNLGFTLLLIIFLLITIRDISKFVEPIHNLFSSF